MYCRTLTANPRSFNLPSVSDCKLCSKCRDSGGQGLACMLAPGTAIAGKAPATINSSIFVKGGQAVRASCPGWTESQQPPLSRVSRGCGHLIRIPAEANIECASVGDHAIFLTHVMVSVAATSYYSAAEPRNIGKQSFQSHKKPGGYHNVHVWITATRHIAL